MARVRLRNGWTQPMNDALKAMLSMGATEEEIAAAVGKSLPAVKSKIAALNGEYASRTRKSEAAMAARIPPRSNDCEKHLRLIAKANGGKGFPALILPPAYRVAA